MNGQVDLEDMSEVKGKSSKPIGGVSCQLITVEPVFDKGRENVLVSATR
jgi:hypothetical protein